MYRENDPHHPRAADPVRVAAGPALEQQGVARHLAGPGLGMLDHEDHRQPGNERGGREETPRRQVAHHDPG